MGHRFESCPDHLASLWKVRLFYFMSQTPVYVASPVASHTCTAEHFSFAESFSARINLYTSNALSFFCCFDHPQGNYKNNNSNQHNYCVVGFYLLHINFTNFWFKQLQIISKESAKEWQLSFSVAIVITIKTISNLVLKIYPFTGAALRNNSFLAADKYHTSDWRQFCKQKLCQNIFTDWRTI